MTAPRLIELLAGRGVKLSARPGRKLRVEAPRGCLSGGVRRLLAVRKGELLAVLGGDYGLATGEVLIRLLLRGRIGEDGFWAWERWCMATSSAVRREGVVAVAEIEREVYGRLHAATRGPITDKPPNTTLHPMQVSFTSTKEILA